MASQRPGGRPKIPWTASRKRKLLRLYLLSDITINEIQQVLAADGFAPGTRNIQTQLGALLSDNAKYWRDYRPSGTKQMKHRLAQLKRCRANRVSKHTRFKARSLRDSKLVHRHTADASLSLSILTSGSLVQLQDCVMLPAGVPSHSSPPHLGACYSQHQVLYSNGPATLVEDLDERKSSDKEVFLSRSDIPNNNSAFSLSDVPDLVTSDKDHLVRVKYSRPIFVSGKDSSSSISAESKWSHSKMSNIDSSSIQSLRVCPSTKLSRSSSHVNSLLSITNSWNSSLVYAGSASSDRMSTTSNAPLTHREAVSWNELVDETKLDRTASRQHSDFKAASLVSRPCCEFFEYDTYKRSLCNVCGFSEMHHIARFSLSDDSDWIDPNLLDRFGNTPLHHAAASGNTARVLQLMCSGAQFLARNTSGETFLHVYHVDSFERFTELIEVLKKAANLGFPFIIRDYSGRTVLSSIKALMYYWGRDDQAEKDITQILTSAGSMTRSALGCGRTSTHIPHTSGLPGVDKKMKKQKKSLFGLNQLKDALLRSKPRRPKLIESNDNMDTSGDTKLISTLKNWPEKPLPQEQLDCLIQRSDIHMRDERGYTALAIAARQGLREAVVLLLNHGANPNTRSHEKTSVLENVITHLAIAGKENNVQLYARIFSCIVLLADHGAKAMVNVFDEYTWRPPTSTLYITDFRMAVSIEEMRTPL